MQVTFANSDLSDCDSCKPRDQPIFENFNEAQSINGILFQVKPAFHGNESATG